MPAAVEVSGVAKVVQAAGRFHDAVKSGQCWYAHTAAGGVAPGTAVGTTAGFALENPMHSGYGVSVLQISVGYVSGTLGAGFISVTSGEQQDARATGTAIVTRNAQVGNRDQSRSFPFTTATVVAGDLVRCLFTLGAALATTATFPSSAVDNVDGGMLVMPGVRIALEATAAAGTTPLAVYSVLFNEVKL